MTPEIIAAVANIYSTKYSIAELKEFIENETDVSDLKSLQMAVNIKNNVYGTQAKLEL